MKTFILSVIIMSVGGFAAAADRYLRIDSPGVNDSVDPARPVSVSGSGKGLFDGNVVVRIERIDGGELAQVVTTMRRDDIAAAGTWQTRITLPQPVPTDIRLIAFSPSPKEGDAAITSQPVLLKTIGHGLEEIDWQLHEYLGEADELTQVLPDTTAYVRFTNGQIGGSAGCNRYFGPYTTGQDNHLTLTSEIGSTLMACPPAVSRQEQRYLALLSLVTSWQRRDGSLLLFDMDQQPVLIFIAARPARLEDAPWQATGINNGRGGVVSGRNTHLATAVFANGKISGNTGCNQFTATYEITGDLIAIGRAMTTRKHCAEPDDIMEQEQHYLQALARAHAYTLKPDRLELRDMNGSLQVSYRVQ
jgi:heat shock protein HslJ